MLCSITHINTAGNGGFFTLSGRAGWISGNMEGGAELEVVVGVWFDQAERGALYWLQWKNGKLVVDQTRTRYLEPFVTRVAIVQRKGRWEILAGTGDGRLYCLDQNLNTIWQSGRLGA